jgi:hypothetical protein
MVGASSLLLRPKNRSAECMWVQGESVNGQFGANANNVLVDLSAVSNPDGWGPVPDNYATMPPGAGRIGGEARAGELSGGTPRGQVEVQQFGDRLPDGRVTGGWGLGQQAYAGSFRIRSLGEPPRVSPNQMSGFVLRIRTALSTPPHQ